MNAIPETPVQAKRNDPSVLRTVTAFLFWAIVFGISYTQAPLFFSNQNQYFLHGLARADYGFLANDWLANTRDPTPLFSALVEGTHRYLDDAFFHAYYVLVLGIYFVALVGIAEQVGGSRPLFRLTFIALFVLLHSALLRWASARMLGMDYPWYFQAGLAGQYVLGPVFQPSVFGVGLIVAIRLFLDDRPLLAATCAALAAVGHATYLLESAFLVAGFLFVLARERRYRDAIGTGFLALVLVLPSVVYNAMVFGPTSSEIFARSQAILAHFRIPHHTEVKLWCDGMACIQVAWMVAAVFLVRGQRLFAVLAVPLLAAIGLTLLQLATDSDALALLFPWRASVYLVPVATAVILARLLGWLEPRLRPVRRAIAVAAIGLLVAATAGGALITFGKVGYRISSQEDRVMEFVRDHKQPGDLYLVPFDLPDRAQARPGALSADFKPPRSETEGIRRIAFGPQRFRLFTGAPVFVDIKSIPYKDVEVLEWRQRLDENGRIYRALESPADDSSRQFLAQHGITHVIARNDQKVVWPDLEEVHRDDYFCVYRIVPK